MAIGAASLMDSRRGRISRPARDYLSAVNLIAAAHPGNWLRSAIRRLPCVVAGLGVVAVAVMIAVIVTMIVIMAVIMMVVMVMIGMHGRAREHAACHGQPHRRRPRARTAPRSASPCRPTARDQRPVRQRLRAAAGIRLARICTGMWRSPSAHAMRASIGSVGAHLDQRLRLRRRHRPARRCRAPVGRRCAAPSARGKSKLDLGAALLTHVSALGAPFVAGEDQRVGDCSGGSPAGSSRIDAGARHHGQLSRAGVDRGASGWAAFGRLARARRNAATAWACSGGRFASLRMYSLIGHPAERQAGEIEHRADRSALPTGKLTSSAKNSTTTHEHRQHHLAAGRACRPFLPEKTGSRDTIRNAMASV